MWAHNWVHKDPIQWTRGQERVKEQAQMKNPSTFMMQPPFSVVDLYNISSCTMTNISRN